MISEETCIKLTKQGIWPGPFEDLCSFEKRSKIIFSQLERNVDLPECIKKKVLEITNKNFDISSISVPFIFSNKNLYFWEGAATWTHEEGPVKYSSLQFNKALKNGRYLFYNLDEVFSHELLHASRVMYDEPKYEEVFAYRTSLSYLRRYFGPIFESPNDSFAFVILMFLSIISDWVCYFFEYSFGLYLFFPLIIFTLYLLLRLWSKQTNLSRASKNLSSLLTKNVNAIFVLSKLTDNEIDYFAKSSSQKIKKYLLSQSENELRIRLIVSAYFSF